ncbi:MAG: hypothetical protein HON23_05575 [Rickettsiales bacterium]|jgi:hypothetical protein|nr:hypothetical protein [Rickettsiales bacterium]
MRIRLYMSIAMLVQLVVIIIAGNVLYQYNIKSRSISQEISYINEMIISDKSKLKVFKTKYAWLSSPKMITALSKKYLDQDIKSSYGFDVARTYNFKGFGAKVKPTLYTNLDIKNLNTGL